MLDFQQKRKVRSVIYHRATLISLFIIVIIILHSTWVVYQKKRDSEEMKNVSLQNTEELRLRENDLNSKIERLGTDSGIEEEIRSKFSVVKSGEKMVVVVENSDSQASSTDSNLGLWQKILNFFYK